MKPDLSRPRRVHVIGAGGAGMSAIATVLAAMGHTVTGSDLKSSANLERLRALGLQVHVGHDPSHLGAAEMVAVSTAVGPGNPELEAATERGMPVLRRADALAAITATRRTIAVAGTHGKTTTSSMLALILVEAGMRPSFIIGGDLNEIGTGAAWSDGEWLVVEADESDGTFLELSPEVAVVTSVEPDHLEHYGSYEAMRAAFGRFLEGAEVRVACADDAGAAAAAEACSAVTYGTAAAADWRVTDVSLGRSTSFTLSHPDGRRVAAQLPVPGLHNALNAAGAAATALEIGASEEAVTRALARFAGVARRWEFRGEAAGVTYVDDYAHLPGEVRAALATAATGGWERVVCVFQPHRYSRTAALWQDFAGAFDDASVVLVTDVYPAGEAPRPGVSGRLVADAVAGSHSAVEYVPTRSELVARLRQLLRPGDLCITLGAGDLTTLADELLAG